MAESSAASATGPTASATGSAQTSSAPANGQLVLLSLIIVAAVANLNLSVANVALPSIGRAFDASQTTLDLVAVGYSLGLAASVLWLGALGDRYGRKLMLILGVVLSIPACLLAAFAPTIEVLVVARILGGVSAGMAYPTTLALIAALWSGPAGHARSRCGRRSVAASPPLDRWSPGSCSSTSSGARSSSSRCRWPRSRSSWRGASCRPTSTRRPSRSTISAGPVGRPRRLADPGINFLPVPGEGRSRSA